MARIVLMYACSLLLLTISAVSPAAGTPFQGFTRDGQAVRPENWPWPTPQQKVAEQAFPSVIMVSVNDRQGQTLSIGSGFIHSPGVAVTNLQVIDDGGSATIRVVGQKESLPVTGILKLDERNDLAFLSFDNTSIPALPLASGQPAIGDEIYAIGNPRGLKGTFSPGIVSGIRQFDADSLLLITAPISRGSSGGPVLNNRGEVIGVAMTAMRDGQNLNFAVPAAAIRAAAATMGKQTPLEKALAERKKDTISVIKAIGGELTTGVRIHAFDWEGRYDFGSGFTISLKNQLDVVIKNVLVQVVFYDGEGEPIESTLIRHDDTVEPGLARRVSGKVDKSVKRLTTRSSGSLYECTPYTKVEYRVLTFEFDQ
jgi:S1-C subfamily serine protease